MDNGTRLGHKGPKGTFNVGIEGYNSIFEILCNTLKIACKKYNVSIPWYIMTSKQNNEETIDFFINNDYFGYKKEDVIFFIQGELPMVDEKGKILLNKEGLVNFASDGHGGIFYAMRDAGVIYHMKRRNIKWVFISGVDNILVNMVDPTFVGLCAERKVLAGGKSIIKAYPDEKVGAFCKKDNKPSVIEYSEISKEMAEERVKNGELKYGESHILCNIFHIDAIEEISKDKLPYHSAYKKVEYMNENGDVVIEDKPNAYKFEAFIFDAFENLNDMVVMRVKREKEFAPIKNAKGIDSPETAKKLYTEYYKQK